jgi:hypothetical protein
MSDKASTDFWYPKLTSEFLGFIFQTSTPSPLPLPSTSTYIMYDD